MTLRDIWQVCILGKHKHKYERIEDGRTDVRTVENDAITYQRHQCSICKKIVGLDDWQIRDLPTEMLYEKI
jgi:hypothetical protein